MIRRSIGLLTCAPNPKPIASAPPITVNTVFQVASLGKVVFTYAILKLSGSGKIDLDRSLVEYITNEQLAYFTGPFLKDEQIDQITARMILSHTSGFPNWRTKAQDFYIHFTPGTAFLYSGEGSYLLQTVVEEITRQRLDEVMADLVFKPLGMTSSSYSWKEEYETQCASTYDFLGKPTGIEQKFQNNAASGLYSTVSDYARFMTAIMSGEGLSPEMKTAMFTPQIDILRNKDSSLHWGLGPGLQVTPEGVSFWQ